MSTSSVPSRDVVRALLDRYADPDGYVTPRALEGVARLAGLGARDAAALRAGARVRVRVCDEAAATGGAADRGEVAAAVADAAGTDPTGLADAEGHEPQGVSEDYPFPTPQTVTAGDLTAAVAAALAVLENDRFRRRPEARLLSAEAEVGLAVLVRGGPDRLAEEPDDETLSGLPPQDLRIRARDCLVLHNQRLVHKLVPRYLDQGLDYDDLFQHGALGLMRAARKFDPAKGFKFSTYATWWVRQAISRGIADEGAVIRIPVHMHEQVRKVALAERTLAIQGRPAGVADVAVYCDMTTQKVEEARKLSRRTDSLDRVIGDGVTLGDFIGRTNPLPSVEKAVLDAMLLAQALTVVDTFTGREARILVRRLGLDGDETLTLDELGREFGVSRERIRQIEVKILPLLKQRLRAAGLTAAYQYNGGLDSDAGEPAGRQDSVPEAGAKAKARRKNSGEKRVPDTLSPPAPQESARDVPVQPAATADSPATERLREETAPAAAPADHALRAEPEVRQADRRSEDGSASGRGLVPKQRTEPVPASGSAQVVTEARGPAVPEPVAPEPTQYPADWQKALRMPAEFGGGVAWLAEYALLAVGHAQLVVLLGPSSADMVVHAVRDRGMLDRPVITALEVLRRVFDAVKEAGLRPEDFFESPVEALAGMTPRAYLAAKPLVSGESRLALRDALREFVTTVPPQAGLGAAPADSARGVGARTRSKSAPGPDSVQLRAAGAPDEDRLEAADGNGRLEVGRNHGRNHVETEADTVPDSERPRDGMAGPQVPPVGVSDPSAARGSADAPTAEEPVSVHEAGPRSSFAGNPEQVPRAGDAHRSIRGEAEPAVERRLTDVRHEYEAGLTRVREEAQRQLAAERQAAEARRIAALADTEQQLAALEETLLHRADKALLRRERHLRAQAEERIARLEDGHHEAQRIQVERAEHAELRERTARTALAAAGERGARAEQRAKEAEQVARTAEQRANDAEHRASTAEERAAALYQRANEAQRRAEETGQRLRRYREEGEARIAGLEQRLRQAEDLLAERDAAVRAAQQQAAAQVAAAEQRAAARIAQTEHDAWARITELQQQLAAEREAAANRSTLRDRWRRS
ncbi:sigma-70 family RNA polymerase sigma factor [Streptomyces bobili]